VRQNFFGLPACIHLYNCAFEADRTIPRTAAIVSLNTDDAAPHFFRVRKGDRNKVAIGHRQIAGHRESAAPAHLILRPLNGKSALDDLSMDLFTLGFAIAAAAAITGAAEVIAGRLQSR